MSLAAAQSVVANGLLDWDASKCMRLLDAFAEVAALRDFAAQKRSETAEVLQRDGVIEK